MHLTMRKTISILLFISLSTLLQAQTGGQSSFQFLSIPTSAKQEALGNSVISRFLPDIAFVYKNPALSLPSLHRKADFTFYNYFLDAYAINLLYVHDLPAVASFSFGFQVLDHKQFEKRSATGERIAVFYSSEYSLHLGFSRSLIADKLRMGLSLKPALSYQDQLWSFALLSDIGLLYYDAPKKLSASILLSNVGMQLKTYSDENREAMPFSLQIGVSKQLAHAPFRLSFLLHDLNRFDILGSRVSLATNNNAESAERSPLVIALDQAFAHTAYAIEFLLSKNFNLQVGFDYQKRRELRATVKQGLVGLSGGFSIQTRRFGLNYAFSRFHLAGSTHLFSINIPFVSQKSKPPITNDDAVRTLD